MNSTGSWLEKNYLRRSYLLQDLKNKDDYAKESWVKGTTGRTGKYLECLRSNLISPVWACALTGPISIPLLPGLLAIPTSHASSPTVILFPSAFLERSCTVCACSVAQSCPTLCDPMDCSWPGSSVHGDSAGKNTGVSCHFLFQGNLPNPGIELRSPALQEDFFYHLSHQGSLVKGGTNGTPE